MDFVATLLATKAVYLGLGLVFGIAFVLWGAPRIDPAAADRTWGCKLLTLPAAVALWPYLAWRWIKGAQPPSERNAHRLHARTATREAAGRSER